MSPPHVVKIERNTEKKLEKNETEKLPHFSGYNTVRVNHLDLKRRSVTGLSNKKLLKKH